MWPQSVRYIGLLGLLHEVNESLLESFRSDGWDVDIVGIGGDGRERERFRVSLSFVLRWPGVVGFRVARSFSFSAVYHGEGLNHREPCSLSLVENVDPETGYEEYYYEWSGATFDNFDVSRLYQDMSEEVQPPVG